MPQRTPTRIDAALDRYEEAAKRRGYTPSFRPAYDFEEPFVETTFIDACKHQNWTAPNEYLSLLTRYDGMFLKKPGFDYNIYIGLNIYLFPARGTLSFHANNVEQARLQVAPENKEFYKEESKFAFFSSSHCLVGGALCDLGDYELLFRVDGSDGGVVHHRDLTTKEILPAFDSLSAVIECCAEGLEQGLPTEHGGAFPDWIARVEADWALRYAWLDIFKRNSPYSEIWRREEELFKQIEDGLIESEERRREFFAKAGITFGDKPSNKDTKATDDDGNT